MNARQPTRQPGRQPRKLSRRAFLAGAATTAAALAGLSACALDPANPANRAAGQLRVGSAMFPESEIIARIWARALTEAGHDVEVVPQIGARDVYLAALQEGSVDLVPEYSGNLAAYFGEVPEGADPAGVLAALDANLPQDLEAVAPAEAESKDAYRVLRSVADEHGLASLADLPKLADAAGAIRIGGSPELAQQPYGPDGLAKVYGVDRGALEMVVYGDSGGPLTIRALADGAVDIADIYTTTPLRDPSGADVDVVTLEDPKQLIPAQNVVALARRDVLDDSARRALESVNSRLTTADLTAMNLRASGDEKAGAELIARDWLGAGAS
ncbi:ABC transporter substrate-binding protein [Corynebacterium hansenii]|uniref:ABC transporter substrate-binding protein n=1 Tax=Corynebacterium hansenii TaxID=394964 RepID=A0ABV7ZPV8_9CORY|nr:ABC transporter substrate-binding protein [Corynebacterium hansenii]WJZ01182.1 Putative osmoprotectant uptake system substrate-binding protein OsmF precursor [Corynebacterium hansenii]